MASVCGLAAAVLAIAGAAAGVVAALAIAAGVAAAALAVALVQRERQVARVVAVAGALAADDMTARVSADDSQTDALASAFDRMAAALQARVEAAATEKSRLQAALDSSTDAVVAVDANSRIVFANTAAHQVFGRSGGSPVGDPFVWLIADHQIVEALRATREEGRREARIVERPGKHYYQAITTPIVAGGDWAALAVFHDITEVKRAEQMRRDFVANVSHELRTPLAALKSVVETLQSGALDDRQVTQTFLEQADGEIDRLVQMVEELLELSRIESGDVPLETKPVEMGALLLRAVTRLRPQAERRGLRLELDVGDNLPVVEGDPEQLERVVVNLVHNALKFTSEGGEVRVSAEALDSSLAVHVQDNGAGILPSDLSRIFERFYKADRSRGGGGTGLGLALARHTIEAHGGEMTVESTPEKGSRFTFVLPLPATR
jgi:two-component system phosphate regulon sensor histidine kinase PhoR